MVSNWSAPTSATKQPWPGQHWRRNLREYDAVNYQGALNVAHAALDNGAKRVLHTSAESILTLAANFVGDPVEQRELEKGDMLKPHCLTRIRLTTR